MYQKAHGINPRDSVVIAFSQFHVQKTLGGLCHCGINKRQKCDKAANNIVYSKSFSPNTSNIILEVYRDTGIITNVRI